MEYRRTAVIKLDTPSDAKPALRETVEQFKHCANRASEWCWHGRRQIPPESGCQPETRSVSGDDDGYHVTSKATAERALYDPLRDETDLTANLVQKGIRRAVEAVKSGVERLKRGENTSKPHFSADSVVYDKRSATFHRDHVSLSTVDGRVECEYILPDDTEKPPTKYVSDDDFEFRMGHLQHRDGDWYLHASMRKVEADETPDPDTKHRTVLGVDLGVNNIAVASTGRFWSADEFNHWRREYEKRRGSLQQCGSRHAHENVQSIGRKEDGRFEQDLHTIANELLEEAIEYGCSHIVFEDLTHIRENIPDATWQHVWAFRRLYEYVEYKAKEYGLSVEQVPPENTSKRCSTCGCTHDDNRNGESFECQKCGYENHADYNASKNIGFRYLRRRQNADDGGAPVGVALNRGTLNVSGEYSPASDGLNGSPRESPRF
ncbi:RNA-guided endonuclease InsQ/TnpB family protein [Halogeometricum luteum]|uniref:Transposase n=1 Tax=Halogeometricum luteum TaxID=2950537 RepID=A0ABU2G2E8_9EURY|nr:transposase [Halogeometricum sp. S3BR5-2]MDS0294946.1 transposase [Halogeometricum sp. S3BR5-2]